MRLRVLGAAAAFGALWCVQHVGAREITQSEEAYFHLHQAVAFAEAFADKKCPGGLKLAQVNFEESKRAAGDETLHPFLERAATSIQEDPPSKKTLALLRKDLQTYAKQRRITHAKAWDKDILSRCNSSIPF